MDDYSDDKLASLDTSDFTVDSFDDIPSYTEAEDTQESEASSEHEYTDSDESDSYDGDDTTDADYVDEDDDDEDGAEAPTQLSAESELAKLLNTPIRGGGEEVTLRSAEEALHLIQMGLGAQKKFQQIAGYRKQMHKLEQANLANDPEKFNLMLDIMSGDKEAIRKHLSDNSIDLDDLDVDTPVNYVTRQTDIQDSTLDLREILDDVGSTAAGSKAIQAVHQNWDEQSKQVLLANPKEFYNLRKHMEDGSYDKIMQEVRHRILVGQLASNVNTLQAYAQVGREMLGGGQPQQARSQQRSSNPQQTQMLNQDNRRKAAKTRKSGNRNPLPTDDELANLSDDEFLKRMHEFY